MRNHQFWESWLRSAPDKSFTVYMHSQQPLKVETQLFADSLVDYYTTSCTEKVWHTPEPVLVQLASIFDTDPFFFFVN